MATKKPANGATKPESIKEREKAKLDGAIKSGVAAEIIKAAKIDAKNIIGELADAFIAEEKAAKHRPDWEKLKQEEQQERLDAAKHRASEFVAGVVAAIYDRGGVASVEASVSKIDFTPGEKTAKVACVIVQTPETLEHFAKGMTRVKILFADTEQFDGPMVTEASPDQPDMIDGAGDEEVEHDADTGEIMEPLDSTTAANANRKPEAPATT